MRPDQPRPLKQGQLVGSQRRARQLQERMRRDQRLRQQEIHERAERDVPPRDDSEPLPRID